MSLRSLRRSIGAACSVLAVGGALSVAAAPASAANLQPAVNSQLTNAEGALVLGYNTLWYLQTQAHNPLATTSYTTELTSAAQLTPTAVSAEMTTWNAYNGTTATDTSAQTTLGQAWDAVTSGAGQPSLDKYTYAELIVGSASAQPVLTGADDIYQLAQLAGYDATDYPNGLFSVDGALTISSTATVKTTTLPSAFTTTIQTGSAVSGGYVLPSAFTLSIPGKYRLNTTLAGKVLPATDEANPPSSGYIGTVTVDSPATIGFGLGTSKTLVGHVVLVGAPTSPSMELWFANGIYELGTFSGLSFPLTVSFGEANVLGATDPLPFSSVTLNFPAATSPVIALNCKNLGQVTGNATDNAAALAAQAGDTADSGSVALTASKTAVTDVCAPLGRAGHVLRLKTGKPTLSFVVKGNGGSKFKAVMVRLPAGFTYRGKRVVRMHFRPTNSKRIVLKGMKATKRELRAKRAAVAFSVVYAAGNMTSADGMLKLKL